jgi:hypothetical protein
MAKNHCAPTTKNPLKSKVNWLVNLPLVLLALSATLHDPAVMVDSPLAPSTMRWILWGLAIASVLFRNVGEQKKLAWRNQNNPEDIPETDPKYTVIVGERPANSDSSHG